MLHLVLIIALENLIVFSSPCRPKGDPSQPSNKRQDPPTGSGGFLQIKLVNPNFNDFTPTKRKGATGHLEGARRPQSVLWPTQQH